VFFGKKLGLIVFRSPSLKKNLGWYEIDGESVDDYLLGILELIGSGFDIVGVTVDGKPGVLSALEKQGIPVQMCHFHQIQIVSRYTTRHPRLLPARELLHLSRLLPRTDKASFEFWLKEWFMKWESFLNEKSFDPIKDRIRFTHERLRKAYRSLKKHLPYLYTYLDYPEMTNTTNSIEGVFSQLKTKVSVHRGLRSDRKRRLIYELLR
jgi:hypothetical protein